MYVCVWERERESVCVCVCVCMCVIAEIQILWCLANVSFLRMRLSDHEDIDEKRTVTKYHWQYIYSLLT